MHVLKKKGRFLSTLDRQIVKPAPIWLMRQAGRYLPEYRAIREKAGSFWAMCMNPALAAEISLQPVRRFGFDAAILFSDILVIPMALGVEVSIEEKVGPRMRPIASVGELSEDEQLWSSKLSPVYEAMARTRAGLDAGTALIGFAGGAWTLATYLAQGQGSTDQRAAKLWAYRDPAGFDQLLELLADCVGRHLVAQVRAGADAVQIFESWASGLPAQAFANWVIKPTRRIVARLRRDCPGTPIIGFPRATSLEGYRLYASQTDVDAISVDTASPIEWAATTLGPKRIVQGNLDPIVLVAGGEALDEAAQTILEATKAIPFIFNLGHGILPETPLEHVEQLVARVRAS
ncbi:MAG: uroporphyrinogen decarboxylase [Alphaproteobacteria bacterium]|nr:uroporphyrinogen decarboxylase [Alphaproteobacteria bacterium]